MLAKVRIQNPHVVRANPKNKIPVSIIQFIIFFLGSIPHLKIFQTVRPGSTPGICSVMVAQRSLKTDPVAFQKGENYAIRRSS